MEILEFIFVLGINFSIFGFIWGIFMMLIKAIQPPAHQRNEGLTYIFRIVKYFLLVSVTANFIMVYETGHVGQQVSTQNIVVGSIVMGLYLLGKLQNRAMMNQLANNPMVSKLVPKVDPKVERFLLIGSMAYFIACLLYPRMVSNAVINWFTDSIFGIYETPIIGWIFSVIAFFFLISIFMRAANVIQRLINGESITENPSSGGSFQMHMGGMDFDKKEDDLYDNEENEDGFSDYEDVTEDEDDDESDPGKTLSDKNEK